MQTLWLVASGIEGEYTTPQPIGMRGGVTHHTHITRPLLTNPRRTGRNRVAVATLERTSVTMATMTETRNAIRGVGRHRNTVK